MEPLICFAAVDNQSGGSCTPVNRITLIECQPKPAVVNINPYCVHLWEKLLCGITNNTHTRMQ